MESWKSKIYVKQNFKYILGWQSHVIFPTRTSIDLSLQEFLRFPLPSSFSLHTLSRRTINQPIVMLLLHHLPSVKLRARVKTFRFGRPPPCPWISRLGEFRDPVNRCVYGVLWGASPTCLVHGLCDFSPVVGVLDTSLAGDLPLFYICGAGIGLSLSVRLMPGVVGLGCAGLVGTALWISGYGFARPYCGIPILCMLPASVVGRWGQDEAS